MIESIRKHFNIYNRIIGFYIDRSTSYVDSVIVGRRALNLSELNKLMVLYKALELTTQVTALNEVVTFINEERKKAAPQLEKQVQKITSNLEHVQNRLDQLQQKRETWLRGLHAATIVEKNETLSSADYKWIRLRKKHLEIQLAAYSYYKELELQAEVTALQEQLYKLQSFIEMLAK